MPVEYPKKPKQPIFKSDKDLYAALVIFFTLLAIFTASVGMIWRAIPVERTEKVTRVISWVKPDVIVRKVPVDRPVDRVIRQDIAIPKVDYKGPKSVCAGGWPQRLKTTTVQANKDNTDNRTWTTGIPIGQVGVVSCGYEGAWTEWKAGDVISTVSGEAM
jgi:hypothetical protein